MTQQAIQKTGKWLLGATVGAIIAAGVAPDLGLKLISGSVAAAGLGAIGNSVVTRRRLSEAEYQMQQALDLKVAKIRSKYEIKLRETQSKLSQIARDEEQDQQRDALIQQLQKELEDFRTANMILHERWQQAQLDASEELEQIKSEYEVSLQTAIEEGVGQKVAEIRRTLYETEYLPKLNAYVQKQINRQNQLKAEIELQNQQAGQAVEHYRGLAIELKDRCIDVTESLEGWIQEQERWKQEQVEKVAFVIDAIQRQHLEEVERLQGQIHQFLKPVRLISTSKAAIVANQIADWYLQRNVVIDVEDAKSWTTKDEIWVKTRGMGMKPLKELSEQLWEEFELAQEPEFDIENGCVKITVFNDEPLDPSVTYKALKSADETIAKHVEASDGLAFKIFKAEERLRQFIKTSERLHVHISGDSGSGKDTLMNNFANLVYHEMAEQDEEVEMIVIDAKYPNDSPIIVNGEVIKPLYRGINNPDGDEAFWIENDVLKGFLALQDEVYRRLAFATHEADNDRPIPKFKKQLWLVSELEQSIAVYDRIVTNCIKTAWRLGRSLNLAVVSNGQSPNAAAYKLMIADLNNTATVYLRDNSYKGVDERVKATEQKRPLKRAIGWLEKNSEGREKDDSERYYGFFKLPGESGFMAFLPPPNAFSGIEEPLLIEESEPDEVKAIAHAPTVSTATEVVNPFSLDGLDLTTGEDELLAAVEERKEEYAPAIPKPVKRDDRLTALSVPAQAIIEAYQRLECCGHKVTPRWVQRKAFRSRELRQLKSADVVETFNELATAGFGAFDEKSKSWWMGELPSGVEQQVLKGD